MIYMKEAMRAFRTGCILSSTVMLGAATEHTFLLLMETIDQSSAHKATFSSVGNERSILRKVNKFRNIIDGMRADLPQVAKEDLDTHFAGILSVIRTFRNESGHHRGRSSTESKRMFNNQPSPLRPSAPSAFIHLPSNPTHDSPGRTGNHSQKPSSFIHPSHQPPRARLNAPRLPEAPPRQKASPSANTSHNTVTSPN